MARCGVRTPGGSEVEITLHCEIGPPVGSGSRSREWNAGTSPDCTRNEVSMTATESST